MRKEEKIERNNTTYILTYRYVRRERKREGNLEKKKREASIIFFSTTKGKEGKEKRDPGKIAERPLSLLGGGEEEGRRARKKGGEKIHVSLSIQAGEKREKLEKERSPNRLSRRHKGERGNKGRGSTAFLVPISGRRGREGEATL